jgi:hypothetical protein
MPLPQRPVIDDAIRFVTSMNKGGGIISKSIEERDSVSKVVENSDLGKFASRFRVEQKLKIDLSPCR